MGRTRRLGAALAAVAAVVLVAGEAWIPLGHETVRYAREAPIDAGAFVNFQGRSVLVGDDAPEWLAEAIDTGRVGFELELMSFWPDQDGPARIFAISGGADRADLLVGQDGLDLVIRVRRPGADERGRPEFRVEDVLVQSQRVDVGVAINGPALTVQVDGRTVVDERTDGGSITSTWDPAQRVVIGDEVEGGHSWVGGMFEATVVAGDTSIPLVASGAVRPGTGTVTYERPRVIDRPSDWSPLVALLRALLFLPLGYVVGSRIRRAVPAVAAAVGIVVAVTAGKWLVPDRHPSVPEVLFGAVGVIAGVAIARHRATRVPAGDVAPPVPAATGLPAVETDRAGVGSDREKG